MGIFDFNRKTENEEKTIRIIVDAISIENSPLLSWIDLDEKQQAELCFFHFAYGWLFMQDYNLIEAKADKIKLYSKYCFLVMRRVYPSIDFETYFELFVDRFVKHREEISMIRGSSLNSSDRFPKYLFSRILFHPLEIETIEFATFNGTEWSTFELSDMYAHQVNYLEQKLKLHK